MYYSGVIINCCEARLYRRAMTFIGLVHLVLIFSITRLFYNRASFSRPSTFVSRRVILCTLENAMLSVLTPFGSRS